MSECIPYVFYSKYLLAFVPEKEGTSVRWLGSLESSPSFSFPSADVLFCPNWNDFSVLNLGRDEGRELRAPEVLRTYFRKGKVGKVFLICTNNRVFLLTHRQLIYRPKASTVYLCAQ